MTSTPASRPEGEDDCNEPQEPALQSPGLARLTRAATRGARSATSSRQRIADAAQQAMDRWQDALLSGKAIGDAEAWVFRVAANAAKRLGGQPRSLPSLGDPQDGSEGRSMPAPADEDDTPHELRKLLGDGPSQAYMRQQIHRLSRKQMRVVEHMCLPGMTFRRAAKELGMDRSGLRRMYARALRNLRDLNKRSPPPP